MTASLPLLPLNLHSFASYEAFLFSSFTTTLLSMLCIISPILSGEFVPNQLTPDRNANGRMDIMRCKMESAQAAYMELARSEQEITVQILREDFTLITFVVPWKTRVQSRYLSRPGDESGADTPTGSSKNPWASKLDPWLGFNETAPGEWKREKLFMCIPGMETAPSRTVGAIGTLLNIYLLTVLHHVT